MLPERAIHERGARRQANRPERLQAERLPEPPPQAALQRRTPPVIELPLRHNDQFSHFRQKTTGFTWQTNCVAKMQGSVHA